MSQHERCSAEDGTSSTERSSLLSNSPSPDNAESEQSDAPLWEEMDQPWPSTYERATQLLASPLLRATDVDLFTKSPKPGSTPQALGRRRNLDRGYYTPEPGTLVKLRQGRGLDRGYYTPDQSNFLQLKQGRGEHLSERDEEDSLQVASSRLQTDEMKLNREKIQKVQAEQARKANLAQAYREKILTQQKKETKKVSNTENGESMSTGYQHEKSTAKHHDGPRTRRNADATFAQCVFNLSNILMGVGLLGLPFALKSAGWYGGIFCVVSFALITWRTSILIGRELNGDPRPTGYFDDSPWKTPIAPGSGLRARMLPPISSFPDIARAAFGQTGSVILSLVLYFELFSCICIFEVAIGDHLHMLFPNISVNHFIILAGVVSLAPSVLLRTPALLSYFSMIGTIATLSVVLCVVFSALLEGDVSAQIAHEKRLTNLKPFHTEWDSSGLAIAFGLVAFCFSGHALVPAIYSSMEKPQEFEKLVTTTFAIVGACCFLVAVSGYYMFGSLVDDQVTLSLEQSSKAGLIMKALTWLMILTGTLFLVCLVATFALARMLYQHILLAAFSKTTLTLFPLAMGVEEIIAPYLTSDASVNLVSAVIKVSLTAATVVVAVFVPSFSLLCALVGMICTMTVSLIFPAAAHLKMFGARLSLVDKVMDVCFILIGVVMGVVGTIVTL